MEEKAERFNTRDLVQITVGSIVGALAYIANGDFWKIGDSLPGINAVIVVFVSLILVWALGYKVGVRKIAGKNVRRILFLVPVRVFVQYFMAVLFSLVLMYVLAINTFETSIEVVLKRTAVLALPASALGSAVDLIDSQKD
ncbi:MAG: DUF2391 family protein [Candidatus Micrarchaeota archaeon]